MTNIYEQMNVTVHNKYHTRTRPKTYMALCLKGKVFNKYILQTIVFEWHQLQCKKNIQQPVGVIITGIITIIIF